MNTVSMTSVHLSGSHWTSVVMILWILTVAMPAVAQDFEGQRPAMPLSGKDLLVQQEAAGVEPWLYAVDRGERDGSGTLYRLGTTASGGTVSVQVVGETGVEDLWDIAFVGDRLLGIGPGSATFGTSDDVLVEIDPDTAVTTPVGTLDVSGHFNALVGESSSTLLGATTTGEVWRLNLSALTASRLGTFGFGQDSSGDLAIALDGTVFGIVAAGSSDRLATVNLSTGRATVVGGTGFPDVYGLAFRPGSGSLIGVADATQDPRLVSINRGTGRATVVGAIPIPEEVTGLAVRSAAAAAACNAGSDAVFLQGGRFRVDACWRTANGSTGVGKLAQRQGIGATLWFFNPNNPELFLKVVDACDPPFERFWAFLAGLTNVEVVVTFTDTVEGVSRTFSNPQGTPMQSVIDTSSFATCP